MLTLSLSLWAIAGSVCLDPVARDYYLSPAGDDNHPGTRLHPWQTIRPLNLTRLQPGDRVLFAGGSTFSGPIVLDHEDSGSADQRVLIGSYGRGRATIDAGAGSGLSATNCSHLIVRDLDFLGCGRNDGNDGNGVAWEGGVDIEIDRVEVSGFRLNGAIFDGVTRGRITRVHAHGNGQSGIATGHHRLSTDLYVAHCVAANNPGDPKNLDNHSGNGIVIGVARNVVVEYCRAYHNGWDMPRAGNGPVGIWCWRAENVVIQHCISHHNRSPGHDGGGFDIDGGCRNAVLQYNLSYNNEGPGYMVCQYPAAPPLLGSVIRYNISQNDGRKNNLRAAIEIHNHNPSGQADGVQIYNNTVFSQHQAALGFGGAEFLGVVLRNNVFVARQTIAGDPRSARLEANLWFSTHPDGFTLGEHSSFAAWVAATGQETVDGQVVGLYADPRLRGLGQVTLTDPTQLRLLDRYLPRLDSPCLTAGLPVVANGGRDFLGTPVPPTGAPGLGAIRGR